MKDSLLFNTDVTYDEYLKIVQNSLDGRTFMCSNAMLQTGVDSLLKIDDMDKWNKVLSCSLTADKLLSPAYSKEKNVDKKIPTILTICHLVNDYYDDVKDLNDKELVLTAFFNSFVEPSELKTNLSFSSNKKLLSTVIKKSNNMIERMKILSVIESNFYELEIDKKDKNSLNNFISRSISFVENNSKDELLSLVASDEEMFETMGKHNIYF